MSHKFSFKEPAKTGHFIEELKKNSVNQEQFMEALEKQTKKLGEFTEPVNLEFKALVADEELLSFFVEYFNMGNALTENANAAKALIPMEIDEDTAAQTGKALTTCLRTIQAGSKGLQYALNILNEEAEFHKNAATSEIELLKEKCEKEIAALRPEVDKKIKKLAQKHDKTTTSTQRTTEKKVAALEKKRDQYVRKLVNVEKRKDATEKRREKAKRKKTSSKSALSTYELDKCDREINHIKKEVKALNDAIDKLKKETNQTLKKLDEEFRKAIAQEEAKIKQINTTYEEKIGDRKKQIDQITKQAAAITTSFENIMDELKHSNAALRQQVEIGFKLDDPENPVLVHLPIYIIKYMKAKEERYTMLSPIAMSEDISVLNGLRKIITFNSDPKLKALTRPASKKLHDMLTTNISDRLQSDVEFKSKINTLCRTNNLIDTTEFAETLNEGLDELTKRGWMTTEEAKDICKRIMREEA
jgi:predicted  nucleic acid-binding Zn-ribbon protein